MLQQALFIIRMMQQRRRFEYLGWSTSALSRVLFANERWASASRMQGEANRDVHQGRSCYLRDFSSERARVSDWVVGARVRPVEHADSGGHNSAHCAANIALRAHTCHAWGASTMRRSLRTTTLQRLRDGL